MSFILWQGFPHHQAKRLRAYVLKTPWWGLKWFCKKHRDNIDSTTLTWPIQFWWCLWCFSVGTTVLPLNAAESPLIVLGLRMLSPNLEKLIPNLPKNGSQKPFWNSETYIDHRPGYILPVGSLGCFHFFPSLTLLWSNWKYKPPECSYYTWFDPRCRVLWWCSDDPKEEDKVFMWQLIEYARCTPAYLGKYITTHFPKPSIRMKGNMSVGALKILKYIMWGSD